MSDGNTAVNTEYDDPYLFDVGPIVLAHADTPVSDRPLSYVRKAIRGEIDAVVPYTALFGAHLILTRYYGFTAENASRVMRRFMRARRIDWYGTVSRTTVESSLDRAAALNVQSWDGYYAEVAISKDVNTILTIDKGDFDGLDGVDVELALTDDEFDELNEYLDAR